MDQNKLKVLRDVRFELQTSCALCVYSEFPQDDWGTCALHEYKHEKHTGDPRKLSIHKCGICPNFELAHWHRAKLGGFGELLDYTNDNRLSPGECARCRTISRPMVGCECDNQ